MLSSEEFVRVAVGSSTRHPQHEMAEEREGGCRWGVGKDGARQADTGTAYGMVCYGAKEQGRYVWFG